MRHPRLSFSDISRCLGLPCTHPSSALSSGFTYRSALRSVLLTNGTHLHTKLFRFGEHPVSRLFCPFAGIFSLLFYDTRGASCMLPLCQLAQLRIRPALSSILLRLVRNRLCHINERVCALHVDLLTGLRSDLVHERRKLISI